MDAAPFFSVIIVSLNGAEVIGRALDALRAQDYARFETIVVDNGSTDDLAEIVRRDYPEVRLVQSPVNLGFAGGNNLGIRVAEGDVIVLLNDDTEARPDWLSALARAAAARPNWGVLGCKLLYPDERTIQHAGGVIQPNGLTNHFGYEEVDEGQCDSPEWCDYVTGAAIAIRRELIDLYGPLDEAYFPIYFEETDFCRATWWLGYEVWYIPDAVVIHHESRTQGRASFKFLLRYSRGRTRYLAKWLMWSEMAGAFKAELKWWTELRAPNVYPAFLLAYLHTLLRLPALALMRRRFRRDFFAMARRHARERRAAAGA